MLSAWISLDASNQNTTFNGSAQTNDLELKFNGMNSSKWLFHKCEWNRHRYKNLS